TGTRILITLSPCHLLTLSLQTMIRGKYMKKKLSIGSWAYIFNQEKPTTDFHQVLHKLQDLGYDGVELGSFGVHPTPVSHPTKADRQRLKKDVADHGLEFSGIAVDLWSFKKPGPSIMDENPKPYMAAFLRFTH